ncbi:MAG: M16 family metallopeptidase [Promethearchaeota archaeon]
MKILTETMQHLNTVTISLATRHGACHETLPGTSSILLPSLSRGTGNHSEEEINLLLDGRGSIFFQDVRGDFSYLSMRVVPEEAREAIDLLFEFLEVPLLAPGIIDAEKSSLVQRISSIMDNPMRRQFVFNIGPAVFGDGHPYANPITGFPDTVREIDRPLLASKLEHGFLIDPVCVIVSNLDDSKIDGLKNQIMVNFERLSGRIAEKRHKFPPLTVGGKNLRMRSDPRATNAYLSLNWRVTPENCSYPILRYVSALLGESFGSRMFRIIRDEKGLSYIAFTNFNQVNDNMLFSNVLDATGARAPEALETVYELTRDLADNEIDDEEFTLTRDYLLGRFDLLCDSPLGLSSALLSSIYHGGPSTSHGLQEELESVTISGIHSWCKEVVRGEYMSLSMDGSYDEEIVRKVWGEIE